eukprot:gnl/MRDRNA2_/MRDRNA2_429740_c0_seq1.p1 gnl/MRDRNA2_/MRDRNA2_429740_c0~~gnl/MRDRNA2_/MRDRNA2_429740_c0_seq1.p1  ORF type:complete len:115 (-),score=15.95 gnl/MRDRNA2_/MRDRNA2_429740_c0_seq1:78-422(-)
MLAFVTGADGCTTTLYKPISWNLNPFLSHGPAEGKRTLPLSTFLTCIDGRDVTDSVGCHSSPALAQGLWCEVPPLDGCITNSLLGLHDFQELQGTLSLDSFLTRIKCGTADDDI